MKDTMHGERKRETKEIPNEVLGTTLHTSMKNEKITKVVMTI